VLPSMVEAENVSDHPRSNLDLEQRCCEQLRNSENVILVGTGRRITLTRLFTRLFLRVQTGLNSRTFPGLSCTLLAEHAIQWSWVGKWGQLVPPKRWYISARLDGVTSHMTPQPWRLGLIEFWRLVGSSFQRVVLSFTLRLLYAVVEEFPPCL